MKLILLNRQTLVLLSFLILVTLLPTFVNAQKGMPAYPYTEVFFESTWEQMANYEKKRKGPSLEGIQVLNEEFISSNIILKNDTCIYQDVPVRINIYENALEVNYKGEVKYLPANRIEKIELQGKSKPFLTQNSFSTKVPAPEGFYKLLYEQKSTLLCHYSYTIKEANYNVALDVGQENDEIVIERNYYIILNNEMIKLEKNRRKLVKQLGADKEVQDFLKKNRINLKDEQDMVKFLEFYDSAFNNCLNA
jgi:hypothetical protein